MAEKKKIFVMMPLRHEFEPVYALIRDAAAKILWDAEVFRIDVIIHIKPIIDTLYQSIERSDLLIFDLSTMNPNVMYELGIAHALQRPVIVIAQNTESIPFDVRGVQLLIYDLDRGADFVRRLQPLISEALENPSVFSTRPFTEPTVNRVFLSYSHKDREFLDRLMVHLRPLERQGLIDLWVDTRLKAGDKWKRAIEEALSQARVAVLLITADFLASDFIVDNELPPLLANAEAKGTRVIPVILKPCRFVRDKNLSAFQAINDPSAPLVQLGHGKQEQIYDKISALVEGAMVS